MEKRGAVLLTGATGYVGGRLLPLLVADRWQLRCLARHPENLAPHVPQGVEVVRGDLLDVPSLPPVMAGIDAAFYWSTRWGRATIFRNRRRIRPLADQRLGECAWLENWRAR